MALQREAVRAVVVSTMMIVASLWWGVFVIWHERLSLPPFAVRPVPSFSATSIAGEQLDSGALCGRPIVLNLWATWCAPCAAEAPELVALKSAFAGQLEVVGISLDDPGPDVTQRVRVFAARHALNFPVFIASQELRSRLPPVQALPATFLVNSSCYMVREFTGRITFSQVKPYIDQLTQR
jgi:thiol-disulfide isomerase/thioredoxin